MMAATAVIIIFRNIKASMRTFVLLQYLVIDLLDCFGVIAPLCPGLRLFRYPGTHRISSVAGVVG
jgi:hypothetical protein